MTELTLEKTMKNEKIESVTSNLLSLSADNKTIEDGVMAEAANLINELSASLKEAERVVAFYANPRNWDTVDGTGTPLAHTDSGGMARSYTND